MHSLFLRSNLFFSLLSTSAMSLLYECINTVVSGEITNLLRENNCGNLEKVFLVQLYPLNFVHMKKNKKISMIDITWNAQFEVHRSRQVSISLLNAIILSLRTFCCPRNPCRVPWKKFWVSWNSILKTLALNPYMYLILEIIEDRDSSFELRLSTYFWLVRYV